MPAMELWASCPQKHTAYSHSTDWIISDWLCCRTNFDCDNLESFLTGLGGGGKFKGKMEKGVENPYSCLVLAGARSMDQRRDALQVCHMQPC